MHSPLAQQQIIMCYAGRVGSIFALMIHFNRAHDVTVRGFTHDDARWCKHSHEKYAQRRVVSSTKEWGIYFLFCPPSSIL